MFCLIFLRVPIILPTILTRSFLCFSLKAHQFSREHNRNVRSKDQKAEEEEEACIPSPLDMLLAHRDLWFTSSGKAWTCSLLSRCNDTTQIRQNLSPLTQRKLISKDMFGHWKLLHLLFCSQVLEAYSHWFSTENYTMWRWSDVMMWFFQDNCFSAKAYYAYYYAMLTTNCVTESNRVF